MAELVGAISGVAGLAPLAAQLVEAAFKLKGLYKKARGAPQTILDLTDYLETTAEYLKLLERHQELDHGGGPLLERCISRCKDEAKKMEALVRKLQRTLERFAKLGRLYIAFKEPGVERMVEELDRSQNAVFRVYEHYCA